MTWRTMSTYSIGPGQRLLERLAVPSLDDLGPGHAESEHEPAPRQMVEGDGGHAHGRRRAGRQLAQGRAQADPLGLGAPPAERGQRVGAVGLGRPDRVEAQPLGFGHQLRWRWPVGRSPSSRVAVRASCPSWVPPWWMRPLDLSGGVETDRRPARPALSPTTLTPMAPMMCSANCPHIGRSFGVDATPACRRPWPAPPSTEHTGCR